MIKRIFFPVILAAILVTSCLQPPVTFDKPQPEDVKPLSEFPARLHGKYLSEDDGTTVEITAGSMIRFYDYDEKIHLSQLDSTKQLIGDTLYDLNTNESAFVKIEGDSLVEHVFETDTLFFFSEYTVLKKFKGYYFLNIAAGDGWVVQKLELSRGTLTFSKINVYEDLAQLKEITESAQDTAPYVFSPSKKEFKQFVRNEGFRNSEVLRKIGR